MPIDITTVADDLVVMHDGLDVRRYDGLAADADHDLDGVPVRTLARPAFRPTSRPLRALRISSSVLVWSAIGGGNSLPCP
jgi:hypothetical protein